MSDNIAYLIPPGKIRCYVTGKLRKDTPEENVRQRWARSLVEEYGYSQDDIGIEVKVSMGRARKFADLVVYAPGSDHTQENVSIIVEAKRDDKKPSDDKGGDEQLKSYMAACPACTFGLWVGVERRAYQKLEARMERVPDIPRFGSDGSKRPTRADLSQTRELKSVFKRCHNYLFANSGLHKDVAFRELLNLIFCKTYDEEESGEELMFCVDPKERMNEAGQRRTKEERIDLLFERVKQKYPFIFEETDRIRLEPAHVAYVVHELQFLSLLDTDTDVKGEAYEELVGANLRGDRGQYFTPRNVCNMAVRMAMNLFLPTQLTNLRVLDCCCGTGGFLVSWLNNLHSIILAQEESRPAQSRTSPGERARRRIKDVCERNLYGLDISPDLVRTCQMNLVLHGDGSSNIYRVNSVKSPGEWNDEAQRQIPYGKVDVLFTNPPFGGRGMIDDRHTLAKYELPVWGRDAMRAAMPAEQLFIETALRFVKPRGYMVIVVPDGIVNNPSLRYIRHWLLRRTRIVASVGLPKTTFAASKGINNPTLLIAKKLTIEEASQADKGILAEPYDVFMSRPQTSGITARVKPIYLRHEDGQEMVNDVGDRILDDEIGRVADQFKQWLRPRDSWGDGQHC